MAIATKTNTSDKLSALAVEKAKPSKKPVKLADGGGLYLYITPNGSKLWRLAYRFDSKQGTQALGAYPQVSLSECWNQLNFDH